MNPHWTANDLLIDGVKFHYTRTGDSSKPPLVLAHGFSDNGLCWLPTARALEGEYDVILPDARGHGLSARVQPGEAINRAEDLARLIQALGLNRPVVGGHSMGASTTAQLDVLFPGLARAIILEDPVWFDRPAAPPETPPAPPANPFQDFLTKAHNASFAELVELCHAQNPAWSEEELPVWAESKHQFDLNVFQTRDNSPMDAEEQIAKISCPALLVSAEVEKGGIVSAATAQRAAAANPHIRWAPIGGAGHNIRRENFPAYIAAVKKFLKNLD